MAHSACAGRRFASTSGDPPDPPRTNTPSGGLPFCWDTARYTEPTSSIGQSFGFCTILDDATCADHITAPVFTGRMVIAILAALLVVALGLAGVLFRRAKNTAQERDAVAGALANLTARFQGVVDVEAERQRVLLELDAERSRFQVEIGRARVEQEQEKQRLLREVEAERVRAQTQSVELYRNLEAERGRFKAEQATARAEHERALTALQEQRLRVNMEMTSLQSSIEKLRAEFHALDEQANLQSFGFYKPRYAFADSRKYQVKLEEIRERQKLMLSTKKAAGCAIEWTVNGSASEGRKSTNQTLKLMLRAFNGESDAALGKVKYNNLHVMKARIEKAWEAINALAVVQQCSISGQYLDLKVQELLLVHEYEEKLQEEREEQRRIREQMRDEERALKEIEKAQLDAEKEEQRYAEALRKAQADVERAAGAKQQKLLGQIEELQRKLADAQTNKQKAISQAQLTKSGHVYVLSNIGSFGEQVYKIGMTRRLDPMERVQELGDASVPFQFDVHAMIHSLDAPALEAELHRTFHHRRVNRINERKEFFKVTIEEIAAEVERRHRGEIRLTLAAEAVEYRKTVALIEEERAS